jgi:hypothetical protein
MPPEAAQELFNFASRLNLRFDMNSGLIFLWLIFVPIAILAMLIWFVSGKFGQKPRAWIQKHKEVFEPIAASLLAIMALIVSAVQINMAFQDADDRKQKEKLDRRAGYAEFQEIQLDYSALTDGTFQGQFGASTKEEKLAIIKEIRRLFVPLIRNPLIQPNSVAEKRLRQMLFECGKLEQQIKFQPASEWDDKMHLRIYEHFWELWWDVQMISAHELDMTPSYQSDKIPAATPRK